MKVIVPFILHPYTLAAYNRACGYVQGFTDLGVNVKFIVFTTRAHEHLVKTTPNTEYIYITENTKRIFSPNQTSDTLLKYLNEGDVLFSFDVTDSIVYPLLGVKRIKLITEITENPDLLYARRPILGLWRRYVSNKIWKQASHIFVITHSLKKYLIERGYAAEKISIINMFVDPNHFSGVSLDNNCEDYIAYCGSISLKKDGVDTLIKAFSIFVNSHPTYKLKLIGKMANKPNEIEIKSLIENLDLRDKVELTGMVSPNEMPKLLVNAKILALARPDNIQAQYGFPTKLGEYLSTGNPVVLTRVGELDNFLCDKKNCLFSRPDDPDDFAEKLKWVADNYLISKNIGLSAVNLVKNEFSYLSQTQKVVNIIR